MSVPSESQQPVDRSNAVTDRDERPNDGYDQMLDQLHELQRQTIASIDQCLGPRKERRLRQLFESHRPALDQIPPEPPFVVSLPLYADDEGIQLEESARALASAIQELKQLAVSRDVGIPSIIRRLYQLHTVADTLSERAHSYHFQTTVHAADHLWTTALLGYEVGHTSGSDALHILDRYSDISLDPTDPAIFLCGSQHLFSGPDLDDLNSHGPICHPCAAEFTRRVFTSGGLLFGRVSKPDLNRTCRAESCQHADRTFPGDVDTGNEKLRRLDEALSAAIAADINDPARISALLDKLRVNYEHVLIEPNQRTKLGTNPLSNHPPGQEP